MPAPRRAWLATAVMATFVVAGCGAAGPLPSAGDDSPTAVSPSPDASQLVAGACPNFVEVVETGPIPGDDGTEDGPVAREQQRISGDVDAASAYGAAHPDEFASVRYENGPWVRLVIGFTAHIEEHCAALREFLEYPDEFQIIRQSATEVQLEAAMAEIVEMVDESFQSVGRGAGVIHVNLRADGEAVAAQILGAYPELVEITVGMLPYPDPFAGDPSCGLGDSSPSGAPLVAEATLDVVPVHPGEDFGGNVTIRNVGASAFDFQSGPTQTAVVYRLGATTPLGFYTGGMDSIGFGKRLAPGESVTLDVIGGTASCDPAIGYALPADAYEVRVRIDVQTTHDNAPTTVAYLLSDPVALTITD
jgi:hypothetical protein